MPPAPFRFSVRTLLIATTAFAVWCVGVSLLPAAFSLVAVGLLSYVVLAVLAAGLLFAEGDRRAFCLGALIVISSMWTGLGGQFMNGVHQLLPIGKPWSFWTDSLLVLLTGAAIGWICLQARRYFCRQKSSQE